MATSEHFDLGDGQWAEIRTDRLHGVVRQVQNAWIKGIHAVDQGIDVPDIDAEVILAMVTGWHVVHNGEAIELSADGIAMTPEGITARLFDRCMAIHREGKEADKVPPPSGAPSGASSPVGQ